MTLHAAGNVLIALSNAGAEDRQGNASACITKYEVEICLAALEGVPIVRAYISSEEGKSESKSIRDRFVRASLPQSLQSQLVGAV